MAWQIRTATRRLLPSLPGTGAHQEQSRTNPRSMQPALTLYLVSSLGIVKDHADGMAVAGADPADAMAQINAIEPARPLHRPVMHSKGDRIALLERNHLGPRLHPRPLLDRKSTRLNSSHLVSSYAVF